MSYRLRNQNNSNQTLGLREEVWFALLELAEDYGWNPMGTIRPGEWLNAWPFQAGYDLGDNYYPGVAYTQADDGRVEPRLVMLEDALNLAEALEQAFLDYEPELELAGVALPGAIAGMIRPQPHIGAISAVVKFCSKGAFWIEPF